MRIIRTDADIADGIAALVALDPRLEAIAAKAGRVPLRRSLAGYQGLARIVVGQVVSEASAAAIWRRLEALLGTVDAAGVARLTDAELLSIGASRAKAATLQAVALACTTGVLDLHAICERPAQEAVAALTAIKGVGLWTAEVYLMICAGHPDVFPAGDIALRSAVRHGLALDAQPSIRELAVAARLWSPWRSVAARLFWSYYAQAMGRSSIALQSPLPSPCQSP